MCTVHDDLGIYIFDDNDINNSIFYSFLKKQSVNIALLNDTIYSNIANVANWQLGHIRPYF